MDEPFYLPDAQKTERHSALEAAARAKRFATFATAAEVERFVAPGAIEASR
ncbi:MULTISPECIES: hypothetical protein [Slackia]|uniref:Uncharacterized protein n=1 Tax=Slackia exigua (strain ATCC 700122 / DSM 15923 / CIP 105133 / JCM 11022 / KCTC 5966 / S-7) TaxID=649764 RepID=D0WH37_SLAES|nr:MULTISPECIES: hypothetical protein [Slackia]EEZ61225.1 hypothetical protein HMPREF0762_01303 [Slackia exigua ATCC 700122]EJU31897.1 hypothetical protein HMPREF1155_1661 [Slackia sp. CM382]